MHQQLTIRAGTGHSFGFCDALQESDIMIRRGPRKASSMGVIVDSQLPHLVGIDDDSVLGEENKS